VNLTGAAVRERRQPARSAYSFSARAMGMGARYSQSAVSAVLYRNSLQCLQSCAMKQGLSWSRQACWQRPARGFASYGARKSFPMLGTVYPLPGVPVQADRPPPGRGKRKLVGLSSLRSRDMPETKHRQSAERRGVHFLLFPELMIFTKSRIAPGTPAGTCRKNAYPVQM